MQASRGYDQAAAWVASELESAGLHPEWAHVPGDGRTRALGILMPRGWDCARAHARLLGGAQPEALCDAETEPLSVILRSAAMKGTFPLVRVDAGTEAAHYDGIDVAGRVVLTRGNVHRVHELAVVERGAAGLLSYGRREFPPVRTATDDADALPYTSFWWGPGMPRGWGFVMTPEAGRRLAGRLQAGEALELEGEIVSTETDTTIPLLSASIPGTTEREVLLVSHLCHPRPSANDNASGAAALLETARVLAQLERSGRWRPGRFGVRFLWMPELSGTCAWLALDRRHASRVVAALNLDMVGEDQSKCGSTLLIEDPPCFNASFAEPLLQAIRHDAQDWITSYSGAGHYSLMRMARVPYGGGSDHAVLADSMVGVPCPMLIQWPDRFYHSSHDTPDKCDPDALALAVRCAGTYAASLSGLAHDDVSALLDLVGRDARRRLLAAMGVPGAARAMTAASIAGRAAISSVERVFDAPREIGAALDAFEGFCERETGRLASAPSSVPPGQPCPVRTAAGPLEFMLHLWPGYAGLATQERARLHAVIDGLPGGRATLDLAWFATDGRRSLPVIAELVAIESGAEVPVLPPPGKPGVSNWTDLFGMLERLGLVTMTARTEPAWALVTPEGPAP